MVRTIEKSSVVVYFLSFVAFTVIYWIDLLEARAAEKLDE